MDSNNQHATPVVPNDETATFEDCKHLIEAERSIRIVAESELSLVKVCFLFCFFFYVK